MAERAPNLVYILADDMGYGDLSCLNPASKIRTPHLDRLAAEGLRCTDAHATSAVCTPSRYSILTGRYNWRSALKRGVNWGYSPRLIEPGRVTVASYLRAHNYSTMCVGKWHLGWMWPRRADADDGDRGDEGDRASFSGRIVLDSSRSLEAGTVRRIRWLEFSAPGTGV
ncbi:MAG: sulfatase-like hydrolase/transferase [bacterium]|nr:sulfatase-like hydrolase/transferase [bacterium]